MLTWWRVRRSPPFPASILSSDLHSAPSSAQPSLHPNGPTRSRAGRRRHLSQVAVDVEKLPLFFHGSSTVPNDTTDTGERIKQETHSTAVSGHWVLKAFIFTHDENRMFSMDLRSGASPKTCPLTMNYVCSCFFRSNHFTHWWAKSCILGAFEGCERS